MNATSELPPSRVVSRFEANLLAILRGFLGFVPRPQLLSLLLQAREAPTCLSRAAVDLVQDTLAKGVTLRLAEQGWQRERFLRDGQAITGRIWERTPPGQLGFHFTRVSLDFLIWATASQCDRGQHWSPPGPLSLGDRLLLAWAYDSVRGSEIAIRWGKQRSWQSDGLCQLLFVDDFSAAAPKVAFDPWLSPGGVVVLEALQRDFTRRWLAAEREKIKLVVPKDMIALGAHQERVLTAYLDALERSQRRDLALWLLPLLRDLLRGDVKVANWTSQLVLGDLRLAERQQIYQQALAVVRVTERLIAWQQHALHAGYFDDGYQGAQLWKSQWEAYNGDELVRRAQALLQANTL